MQKISFMAKAGLLLIFMPLIFATICLANHQTLGGPAFSDPNQITETPEGWSTRPLTFDQDQLNYDLVITLDQHLYAALLPPIQAYAQAHNLNISVNDGTCGISYGKLVKKAVDISGFCCPPGSTDRLPGVEFHTLGIAAIAILVNIDNRLSTLSVEQTRDLFMGEIHRWSELEDEQSTSMLYPIIRPVIRPHCKLRPGHWRLLLGEESLFSQESINVGTIEDMISMISEDPRAIGYEVLWNIERYNKGHKIKPLLINELSPTDQQAVIDNRYPFYRTYNLTTWTSPECKKPAAEALVLHLLKMVDLLDPQHGIISPAKLRTAGWVFRRNELVGEPPSQ
ncbi:MAG: hypothetical protein KJ950_16570 [Proteobacteria bacterium]|nr:hypothetical protein [Pseudomonadota bacterium]